MDLINIHISDKEPFIGYAESRIGGRMENQDSFSFALTKYGLLITVCDGMGGGPAGKKASSIAVTEIVKAVQEADEEQWGSLTAMVTAAVKQANEAVFNAAEEVPELKGMGSTATVLLLNEKSAIVAHVGDSRVYQLRGHQKIFRTFDHSVVFDLVRQGIITEEQARLSVQSNVITRALGVYEEVEVEVNELTYERGDRFMLCSDGVHGCMPENELLEMATSNNQALGPVVDNIATAADDIGRKGGGEHDNLTVAVIQTKNDSKLKEPMSRQTKKILITLAACCFLSLILNIVQCAGGKQTESDEAFAALKAENALLKDSVANLTRQVKENDRTQKQMKPQQSLTEKTNQNNE